MTAGPVHLARRFFGALSPRPPAIADEGWAIGHLLAGEAEIWERMSKPDRRHAIAVARRFCAAQPEAGRPEVAGALLHDCGKVESGLGTFARVGATLWIGAVGPARAGRGDGRIARYARHEPLGAAMLSAAGSDPSTIALVARSADAPALARAALIAADDDD